MSPAEPSQQQEVLLKSTLSPISTKPRQPIRDAQRTDRVERCEQRGSRFPTLLSLTRGLLRSSSWPLASCRGRASHAALPRPFLGLSITERPAPARYGLLSATPGVYRGSSANPCLPGVSLSQRVSLVDWALLWCGSLELADPRGCPCPGVGGLWPFRRCLLGASCPQTPLPPPLCPRPPLLRRLGVGRRQFRADRGGWWVLASKTAVAGGCPGSGAAGPSAVVSRGPFRAVRGRSAAITQARAGGSRVLLLKASGLLLRGGGFFAVDSGANDQQKGWKGRACS